MQASLVLYDDARRSLRCANRLAPKSVFPELWLQWGHFYNQKGESARATAWYKKAVNARPKTTWLIFLGASLAKEGKLMEAKRAHRRAIKRGGPRRDEAHYNLGLIHRAEGNYADALAEFDKAIALDPKYRLAKEARADVLAACER